MSDIAYSNDIGKRLIELGVIPRFTRRAVIDIPLDGPVTIYCEHFGSNKVLDAAELFKAGDPAVVTVNNDSDIRDVTTFVHQAHAYEKAEKKDA